MQIQNHYQNLSEDEEEKKKKKKAWTRLFHKFCQIFDFYLV